MKYVIDISEGNNIAEVIARIKADRHEQTTDEAYGFTQIDVDGLAECEYVEEHKGRIRSVAAHIFQVMSGAHRRGQYAS